MMFPALINSKMCCFEFIIIKYYSTYTRNSATSGSCSCNARK